MTASNFLKRLHARALRGNRFVSLKQFVRELAATGTEEEKTAAAAWKLNKSPAQRRLDKKDRHARKGALIAAQRSATKTARSKKSGGGGGNKSGK